jgi:activator of 2-hydroxyglutaryl-CoA dehydratase
MVIILIPFCPQIAVRPPLYAGLRKLGSFMFTPGIDIGSASSKAIIPRDGEEIAAQAAVQAGTGTSGFDRVLAEVYAASGLKQSDIRFFVTMTDTKIEHKKDEK